MSTRLQTREFAVIRIIEAPLEQVWRAWSDPLYVMRWWGPLGFTCPLARMDFREGGTSLVSMHAPLEEGGQILYNTWTYRRIVPPERFEYILNFTDENGQKIDPAEIGLPAGIPPEVYNVNLFNDLGEGRTQMTVLEFGYTSEQALDLSRTGLEQCLDKLTAIFTRG